MAAAGNQTRDTGAVYLYTFTDDAFSGGRLAAVVGKGYTGGKNVDVGALAGGSPVEFDEDGVPVDFHLTLGDEFGASVSLNGRAPVWRSGRRTTTAPATGRSTPERCICTPSPTKRSRAGGSRRWRARATPGGGTSMSACWRLSTSTRWSDRRRRARLARERLVRRPLRRLGVAERIGHPSRGRVGVRRRRRQPGGQLRSGVSVHLRRRSVLGRAARGGGGQGLHRGAERRCRRAGGGLHRKSG